MTQTTPLEDFFRKPEYVQVRLSPDGRRLSWMAPHGRRLNVFVRDLATGVERRVTEATERDIAGHAWVDDEHLIYAQDRGGDENHRLYAVAHDGSNAIDLTPFEGVKCSVVDDLEDVPGEILFRMNRRNPELFDVYRLKVATGAMECIAENPGNVQGWITDQRGRLRLATTTDGVHTGILYRATESDPWREVASYSFKESAEPLFFTFDDRDIYVCSNLGRDKSAIYRYDLESGQPTELVFEHPEVDVDHLLHSRHRRVLTGVAFVTDKRGYHFFDERRAAIQGFLDERLPGRENALVAHSRDETRYVVHSGGDRTRGGYWLLETDADGPAQLTHLFDASPWLVEEELASMEPIQYTARDGLTIHGYLTRPTGAEGRELPLVVNPHGGPWARDAWGFNAEVQFLASRGVAVLQTNFRGSTGYGRAFWEASFGQWGLSMQDDVTDAVQWAIDEGIADPKRVAIYGGSYGGFATLSGITKTPELYACAVSYVGVSNLFTWTAAFPPYWKPFLEMIHEMVGHPERDAQRWKATSPFFHAEKIRCPLLVAQGANDPRVPKAESDQIVAAVRARGLPVDYLVKENEGHGFHNEENQFEFYRHMETFFREHLGLPVTSSSPVSAVPARSGGPGGSASATPRP